MPAQRHASHLLLYHVAPGADKHPSTRHQWKILTLIRLWEVFLPDAFHTGPSKTCETLQHHPRKGTQVSGHSRPQTTPDRQPTASGAEIDMCSRHPLLLVPRDESKEGLFSLWRACTEKEEADLEAADVCAESGHKGVSRVVDEGKSGC